MTKKYFKTAFIYALFGLFIGAFYREYTRIIGFKGISTLGLAHTHSLVLGFFLFIILALAAKSFDLKDDKKEKRFYTTYNFSLVLVIGTLIARGFYQIYGLDNSAISATISGVSGLGHIAISFAFYFLYAYLKTYIEKC
ncbi:DUF2871 domain-containing protein [Anaerococcus lactolyticus]|uniref:DUF2871 domain-containing protein n=1 Tax=Anaerococcus lactolyticus TaxID=33032 RepID=UPI0028897D70|nr:DUF2871 domain-containing protein [Anaerococcus lactolyticus]